MQKSTQEKPIYFYVANLGSEVQRIFVWKEKGDKEAVQGAFKRAVSIIDKIKSFGNNSANVEMDILKKAIEENILDRNQISLYFNPFALRIVNGL
jgi:hypothetical protein